MEHIVSPSVGNGKKKVDDVFVLRWLYDNCNIFPPPSKGYRQSHALIATQMPLHDTIGDFWRLLHGHGSHSVITLYDFDNTDPEDEVGLQDSQDSGIQGKFWKLNRKFKESDNHYSDCLFNSLFQANKKKASKFCNIGPL